LEFKSLIIVIVGFRKFFRCLVWAIDLGVQITDEGRSLHIVQQKIFRKPTIEIISDLNSTVNCPSQETKETTRPDENVALMTKDLQGKNHNL